MKWPKGKHNGQRIVGFGVQIKIHILYWGWERYWRYGTRMIHIGPFIFNFEIVYE